MTRLGESGFEVSKATGVCAATHQPIPIGEEYIAALVDGEKGLERHDYSLAAWQSGARPKPISRLFGAWKAVMQPPSEKRKALVDDESLFDLFEQLQETTEPARISFRYILALLLMRKKLLKYDGTRRNPGGAVPGQILLVRRTTRADEKPAPQIEVVDPGMDQQAIADSIEQLGAVLAFGGRETIA